MIKEKRADSKGRVTLGQDFANRTVLVEPIEDGVVIRPARVIPESESWLYTNKSALASLRRGLSQAKAGQFSTSPPDLSAAKELADQLEGD
jgi:hypothetical protein